MAVNELRKSKSRAGILFPIGVHRLASQLIQSQLSPAHADGERFGGFALLALMGQQSHPIATPVGFGGISQESLAMFAPQLLAN